MNPIKLLLVLLSLYNCKSATVDDRGEEQHAPDDEIVLTVEQISNIRLTTSQIREVEISKGFSTTGFLDVPPGYKVRLHSVVPCLIESVRKLEGDRVKKGELLLTGKSMEYIEMQKNYMILREELALANLESERQQQLKDVSAQKTMQQTSSTLNRKQTEFEAVKSKLKLLNADFSALEAGRIQPLLYFYSSLNGKISSINVTVGQYAEESLSLLEVVDNHHLHIELNIYENDIGKIKENQKISIRIPGTDKVFPGYVYLKSNVLKNNRSITVHAHFDNEESVEKEEFSIGQFVEVEVATATHTVNALPEEAIYTEGGEDFVFMVAQKDNEAWTFRKTRVTTGTRTGGFVEIDAPQLKGKEFVEQGTYYLISSFSETEGHHH